MAVMRAYDLTVGDWLVEAAELQLLPTGTGLVEPGKIPWGGLLVHYIRMSSSDLPFVVFRSGRAHYSLPRESIVEVA